MTFDYDLGKLNEWKTTTADLLPGPKGHKFKSCDSSGPPLLKSCTARTLPAPVCRLFRGVHLCHLDLLPIYFCLCTYCIPFILQVCCNLLTHTRICRCYCMLQLLDYCRLENFKNRLLN